MRIGRWGPADLQKKKKKRSAVKLKLRFKGVHLEMLEAENVEHATAEIHAIPAPPVSLISFLLRVRSLDAFGNSARGRRSRARNQPNGPATLLSPIKAKCYLLPAAARGGTWSQPHLHCQPTHRVRRRWARNKALDASPPPFPISTQRLT